MNQGECCVCACYVKIDCAQLKLCVYCTQELNQRCGDPCKFVTLEQWTLFTFLEF
jgi:hypothetical protein